MQAAQYSRKASRRRLLVKGKRVSVRRGGGGAVDSGVGREHGADGSPAGNANREADEGTNSARGTTEETVARSAGGGANACPDGSADYQPDHSMRDAFRSGRGRYTDDVYTF